MYSMPMMADLHGSKGRTGSMDGMEGEGIQRRSGIIAAQESTVQKKCVYQFLLIYKRYRTTVVAPSNLGNLFGQNSSHIQRIFKHVNI
jgi:hypothetical protein